VLKGTMQWIFGFAGDRYGRRNLIVAGLLTCVLGLVLLGGVGLSESDPRAGFFIAALLIGLGTAMMYSNLLAAVCDHADPSWRASALGAYRFWRDMGYAVGALVTGAVADWIGIPWSIFVTAMLTAIAAILVFFCYDEVAGDEKSANGVGEMVARGAVEMKMAPDQMQMQMPMQQQQQQLAQYPGMQQQAPYIGVMPMGGVMQGMNYQPQQQPGYPPMNMGRVMMGSA